MAVLVNKNSKIIVQGFTGTEGSFHASQMIEYGTAGGRWRYARQGRNQASRSAGIQYGCRCGENDRRECFHHFCSTGICGGCDHGSSRSEVSRWWFVLQKEYRCRIW